MRIKFHHRRRLMRAQSRKCRRRNEYSSCLSRMTVELLQIDVFRILETKLRRQRVNNNQLLEHLLGKCSTIRLLVRNHTEYKFDKYKRFYVLT